MEFGRKSRKGRGKRSNFNAKADDLRPADPSKLFKNSEELKADRGTPPHRNNPMEEKKRRRAGEKRWVLIPEKAFLRTDSGHLGTFKRRHEKRKEGGRDSTRKERSKGASSLWKGVNDRSWRAPEICNCLGRKGPVVGESKKDNRGSMP